MRVCRNRGEGEWRKSWMREKELNRRCEKEERRKKKEKRKKKKDKELN